MVADAMLAFVLFALDAITAPQTRLPWLFVATGAVLAAPIVFRRRRPLLVAWVLVALSVANTLLTWAVDDSDVGHPSLIGLGIALYTLVAYVGRRPAWIYLVGLGVDTLLAYLLLDQDPTVTLVFAVLLYALCWTSAEFVGARTAYDHEVAARLAVADYDRERSAHEAVTAERTRIARELHDVVAHAVSVMIVQADGASYTLRKNPAAAESALVNIAATGRQALTELRRTVALLRTDEMPEQLPQHGWAGIATVVEMMRAAGLAVDVEQTGQLDDIPPRVSLGIHRIVQESLTNVLRHAGVTPRAEVRVVRRENDVLVEVVDTGTGGAATGFDHGSGNGLVGMRERVAVLHGTLVAGRIATGGWRVRAVLPLELPD